MRYQNEAALPTQHENDAQLFSNMGKTLNGPGGRPRGAWANIAAGAFEGLAHGARSKAIGERKEKYDKYDRVMNYFQEVNNAAIEQNQWYEKREGAKREIMPQIMAYMDNIDRLDPQSQRILAQDMLSQYGNAIGEDFKLSSIDGSNPFLMTIQSSKGQQVFDMRSLFAGDDAMKQAYSMKMPEYQMRLQEERANKERDFQLKEKAIDAKNSKNNPIAEGNEYGSIPIKSLGGKGITPFMQTINAETNLAKDVPVILHQISEAEKIITENPSVGKAWNNYMFSGEVSKGVMSDSTREAYEKLDKITSRVAEAYIRAKGGQISDSERDTIKQGLFKVTNSPKANKYNINSIRQELEIAKERGDFASEQLAKGFIATAGSFEEYKKSKSMQGPFDAMGYPQIGSNDDPWNNVGKRSQ